MSIATIKSSFRTKFVCSVYTSKTNKGLSARTASAAPVAPPSQPKLKYKAHGNDRRFPERGLSIGTGGIKMIDVRLQRGQPQERRLESSIARLPRGQGGGIMPLNRRARYRPDQTAVCIMGDEPSLSNRQ